MANVNVFGAAPAGITPFAEGFGDGADFRMIEHVGKGVIVQVTGPETVQTHLYGPKTAIKCSSVIVLGDDGPVTFSDVLIFNAAPVSQLTSLAGQKIVAQITTYDTKQGGKAPKFDAPTPEQIAAAEKVEVTPPF